MKSAHVALVVSALAMTASGVSIGQLPPSPTKLSQNSKEYESGPGIEAINGRRPARGPLPRTHKRAKGSKNLLKEENVCPFTFFAIALARHSRVFQLW
jgi:hypothetical protein